MCVCVRTSALAQRVNLLLYAFVARLRPSEPSPVSAWTPRFASVGRATEQHVHQLSSGYAELQEIRLWYTSYSTSTHRQSCLDPGSVGLFETGAGRRELGQALVLHQLLWQCAHLLQW